MDTFVEKLNNNPIFQLSLSSKELFHSNFLAWLAEDKNTRTIFNQIMKIWMQDENWEFDDSKMMVKREYYHFDFCICKKVRNYCLLYTSPSPRDRQKSRMPSSA